MPRAQEMADTILVAQDGSAAAQAAADMAIQLAKILNLTIQGMYVVDERIVTDNYSDYRAEAGSDIPTRSRDNLMAAFTARGEVALEWLSARGQEEGVTVETNLLFGAVPELILQQAETVKMIALGRRGHGHPQDSDHLGQNFQAVIHNANLPMLLGGSDGRLLRRILLAYNGTDPAQQALRWSAQLQPGFQGQYTVLVVHENNDQTQAWISNLQSQVAASGLTNFRFIEREVQPATAIVTVAEDTQVDLIVMEGSPRNRFMEWITGSTLDRVLRMTERSVVVV